MRYRVKITPVALTDIQDSIVYYNGQQKGLGKRFSAAVSDTIDTIRKMPLSASIAYEEVRYKLMHKFPFVVIYSIQGDVIVVA